MPHQVQILDCTLRDGGYYNDWDYSFDLVKRYVKAMTAARIDIVELGFRTLHTDGYLGATAYTTDAFIERLEVEPSLRLAVMLNAKEILASTDTRKTIRKAFSPSSRSQVGLVRIAANHNEVDSLGAAVQELKDLGYEVALNLMQVSELDLGSIQDFGLQAKSYGVSYAYVADSFGALRPSDVAPIIKSLGEGFGQAIGCHLHDNMSYALANTMEAVAAGAVIVDATIQGMGRGPGNVRTEYVVMELSERRLTSATVQPLVNLVERDFAELKRDFGWGSSLYYFHSAHLSVHPTYVMELTKDDRYSPAEVVSALNRLNAGGATSFDVRRLTDAVQGEPLSFKGGNVLDNWLTSKDVLIVANSPEARAKRTELSTYISNNRPFVVALNAHLPINPSLVDCVAVCHPERAVLDATELPQLECEIVAPSQLFKSIGIRVGRLRDIGYRVSPGKFGTEDHGVVIPHPLVAAYVLAIVASSGARRIFLAGFDGFSESDPRRSMMQESLDLFTERHPDISISAITRSTYRVTQRSMFAPS